MASKFITVSIEILHDKNLTANEKFILSEIEQLCSLEHGCFASNQHFADLIGITRANASRTITNLTNKGYIVCSIKMGTRNRERSIKLNQTCYQNDNDVVSKRQETKENRQSNKHTNKQDTQKQAKDFKFNLKDKRQYQHLSEEYKQNLLAYAVTKVGNRAKELLGGMIDYHESNGKGFKDWAAAFRTWERNDNKFNSKHTFKSSSEPEVGSIAWRMAQQSKNESAVDVEVVA